MCRSMVSASIWEARLCAGKLAMLRLSVGPEVLTGEDAGNALAPVYAHSTGPAETLAAMSPSALPLLRTAAPEVSACPYGRNRTPFVTFEAQFAEKHGDDCPVNWHPGMKGVRHK